MVVLGMFWFVAIVVTQTYIANRTAFLAVTQGIMPFQTLRDIANDNQYLLLINKNGLKTQLFRVGFIKVYACVSISNLNSILKMILIDKYMGQQLYGSSG